MSEFHALGGPLPAIPDDRTLVQFLLDDWHPTRVARPSGEPWFIDDRTGREVFYDEVRMRVSGLANALKLRYGIKEDDTILMYSPNDIDYPIFMWAVHRLGAIFSGANPNYTVEELSYQARVCKPALLVAHPLSINNAKSVAASLGMPDSRIISLGKVNGVVSADELVEFGLSQPVSYAERRLRPGEAKTKIAFLSFSSGTTGSPKAIPISHYATVVGPVQFATHVGANRSDISRKDKTHRAGDRIAAVLPFFHIFGLSVTLNSMLYCGVSLVVIPKFNLTDLLNSVVKYKITHLSLVPPVAVAIVKHPSLSKYDLSHVHHISVGAAPLTREVEAQIHAVFPQAYVGQGYGMTETVTTVATRSVDRKEPTPGSVGNLLPGYKARVVKADGSLAGCKEEGELWLHNPGSASYYLNNEEATKETFVDGWVRTGDIVFFDEHGDLTIVDRAKEIMKVRGFQVAPAELEGCLLDHPLVADAAVIGVPDAYSGELPLAFVVPAPSRDPRRAASPAAAVAQAERELLAHVAARKTAYKRLAAGVVFVDAVPKNPSGKLLRRLLKGQAREAWEERQRSGRPVPKL